MRDEWRLPLNGGGTDVDPPTRLSPFNLWWMCLVILTDQLIGEYIAVILPGIVSFGVSLPFDQILESSPFPKMAMIPDGLDFIFLFSINDVWGRSREVGSVLFRFLVRG